MILHKRAAFAALALAVATPAFAQVGGTGTLAQRIQKFVDFESFSARFPTPIVKRSVHTRDSLRAVWQELIAARKRGFAREEQENEPGITCVAVALHRGTDVVGAISVTAPSYRMDNKRAVLIIRALREAIEPNLPPGMSLQKPILGVPRRAGRLRKLDEVDGDEEAA